jgi:phosphotransferase system enzyme I (PtsI)
MDEMSMNPQAIPTIKQMIRSIKISDTKPLVEEALKLRSAEKVFALLRDTYGDVLSEFNRTDDGADKVFKEKISSKGAKRRA